MHAPGHMLDADAAEAALAAESKRAERKKRAVSAAGQLTGFLVALLFVFLILGGWAGVLEVEERHPSAGLYGELVFLGLVVWWGLVALSPWLSRFIRWLPTNIEVPPVTNSQGLVWASSIVVAVPIAVKHGMLGAVIAIGTFAATAIGLSPARRRWQWIPQAPVCFSCLAAAIVLLLFAWWQAERLAKLESPPPTAEVANANDLARDLRPLLFMDHEELFPPVDIDDAEKKICRLSLTAVCESLVKEIGDLKSDQYFKVVAAEVDPHDKANGWASAMFHHVFKEGSTLYVDYWWYFSENPAPVARSVLCGRALTRAFLGKGCAEHPADWEGMTLMLVPASCSPTATENSCVTHEGKTYEIKEAQYAQHEKVVVYPWSALQKRWSQDGMKRWAEGAGHRPLVFAALSSHASYATPCNSRVSCLQIVHKGVPERRSGEFSWTNNRGCVDECLKPLPTRRGLPSEWNAVKGRWGSQHCILFGTVCDTQIAPAAPGFQERYKDPCPAAHCIPGPRL